MTYHEWLTQFRERYGRMPTMQERFLWMRQQSAGNGGGGAKPEPEPEPAPEPEPEPGPGPPGMSPELEAILEEFRNALASFTVQPGFITGEGGVGGWSMPVAQWMRQNATGLENMFLEQYMRQAQAAPEGQLPEYTPTDWLSTFDPEQAYRMTPSDVYPTGWRSPVTTVRRLRV